MEELLRMLLADTALDLIDLACKHVAMTKHILIKQGLSEDFVQNAIVQCANRHDEELGAKSLEELLLMVRKEQKNE